MKTAMLGLRLCQGRPGFCAVLHSEECVFVYMDEKTAELNGTPIPVLSYNQFFSEPAYV